MGLIQNFYRILKLLKEANDPNNPLEVKCLCKDWAQTYLKLFGKDQQDENESYEECKHVLCALCFSSTVCALSRLSYSRIPSAYGDLKKFSLQGVEKINDMVTIDFFHSTNRQGIFL
ncbi:unnamed protein product [Didymodactylos carnosus]|uniref:Uncharacterized protein n=1 Tax=Didymodactylos carnosus TaxID=1234261 RepID=A0A814M1R4_9BILA|nr:unnamed protein product [Didymodactylos carnosus]CAF3838524.1 unnamed protein product [Didymodactylos carnosus]